MKIALDARALTRQKPAGKEQFVINVLKELFKSDKANRYILYLNQDFKQFLPPNFFKKIIKASGIFWHFFVILDLFFQRPDVYLSTTSYIVPTFKLKISAVCIIHDLVAVLPDFKYLVSLKARILENLFLRLAIKRSKKIITISQNTKKDIYSLCNVGLHKVSVIYPGFHSRFCPIKDEDKTKKVLRRYGLDKGFIFFVGTLEPRKNIIRLIEAYFRGRFQAKLVIVGKRGWLYQEIFKKIKELNLKNRIVFLDYVPDEDLPYLYNAASCFVYPSLYEGFGLPPLEAMACGCPVITSNISSLPEVVGDAGILVDPYNIDDIAGALKKILSDENLRQELKQKGFIQAQKFSWQKTTKQILKIFQLQ